MKSILSAAICCALLFATGCRSDPNRELLERELRDHEDEIYDLQNQLDDKAHQLEACRRDNATLKNSAGGSSEPGDGHDATPPRVTRPPSEVPEVPKIDLGTPDSTPPGPPPAKTPSESPGPRSANSRSARPASLTRDPPGEIKTLSLDGKGQGTGEIERLTINRLMTGGHSFSGKPGDDGLLVVFAPRDASGRPVQAAGDVAIAVIDPQITGPAARVARWDFSAAEVASHYRQGPLANAFHFDLLWPNQPPEHGELKLFIRFTTPDGRRFEDDQTVRVRLPQDAPPVQSWSKLEAPQRWAPAELPSGGQFVPDADKVRTAVLPPSRPLAKSDSPADANPSDSAPPPRSEARRPGWSPYR